MVARDHFPLPEERLRALGRARRLEWSTLIALSAVSVMMYLTMGGSQAMKTAWLEDMLSLVPPAVFLVCSRIQRRPPDARFPFGRMRVMNVAFVTTSACLLAFGLILLTDALMTIARRDHPTLGAVDLFGRTVWIGWVMLGVLAVSAIPPVILGRLKLRCARELHDKALHADAAMNRADWATALAAMLGIIGIGFGFWWADAAAAAAIALTIVWDGFTNLKRSLADACDQIPTPIESSDPDPIIAKVREAILALPYVREVGLRLLNEGISVSGDARVVLVDEADILDRLDEIERTAKAQHWRIHIIDARPVRTLDA